MLEKEQMLKLLLGVDERIKQDQDNVEFKEKNLNWFGAFINVLLSSTPSEDWRLIYVEDVDYIYVDDGSFSGVIPLCVFSKYVDVDSILPCNEYYYSTYNGIIKEFIESHEDGCIMSFDKFAFPENIKYDDVSEDEQRENSMEILDKIKHTVKSSGNDLSDEIYKSIYTFIYENFYLSYRKLRIKVYTNPIEFSEDTCIKDNLLEHSWAGSSHEVQEVTTIYSYKEFKASEFKSDMYSDNGDITYNDTSEIYAEFDTNDTIVVFVSNHDKSSFNDDYYDRYEYHIHIYIGGNYELPPEKQIIIDKYL